MDGLKTHSDGVVPTSDTAQKSRSFSSRGSTDPSGDAVATNGEAEPIEAPFMPLLAVQHEKYVGSPARIRTVSVAHRGHRRSREHHVPLYDDSATRNV